LNNNSASDILFIPPPAQIGIKTSSTIPSIVLPKLMIFFFSFVASIITNSSSEYAIFANP
jgi:hypothetical protein